ncbi:unnamed protein product [Paramecium octaurelia]|uniref:STOP protein n=1 Tax=Paramecium octaurelia TaxID=43137 RepID=A0A8S1S891_PAROT|nr:unnamed protein product [Paramecium octaurelia]
MINNTIKSLFHSSKSIPSSNQFHNRCVCEICKCGKHHCPIHSDNMHGDFQSTFQHDYLPWKSCKQKPFNYERQPQKHAYDPSTLLSSYQSEYIKRPLPDKEIRELPKIPSSQPFTSQSDYQTNYQRFPLPLKPPVTKKQYKSAPRQVPWDTTYGVDYIPKPIGEKEQFKPTVKDGPNCGTDFGSSTYRTAYIPMPTCKQDKYRDPHQRNLYGDPGQTGNSTYQMDYVEKQNIDDTCPVLALPKRPVKLQGGKSHLNYDAITNRWI